MATSKGINPVQHSERKAGNAKAAPKTKSKAQKKKPKTKGK